ncbi:MAG: SNF2-related protein, partial [Phycisphaerae bacterium]
MPATAAKSTRRVSKAPAKERQVSHLRKPEGLSLEEWQTQLRRQFGRQQPFKLQNIGHAPVFSEFHVTNPLTASTYRVLIRGAAAGENFCACPDFATNTLGTCKHIEFTLARLARRPGGKAALRAGFQPPYSEIMLKYGACREVLFHPGTECPGELRTEARKYFAAAGTLRPQAFATIERFLAAAQQLQHEVRCYEDVLGFIAEVRDGQRRRQRIDTAFPKGIHSAAFDKLLKVDLYDYQREGALFAARAGRCLIGDEMGLGKTVQAIGCAELLARECHIDRVLIICPTSLTYQWKKEIEAFTGRTARVIIGDQMERKEQYGTEEFFTITSYHQAVRDKDIIAAYGPDLIILDLMLGDLDGLEVLKRLKENPRTRAIPIIVLDVKSDRSSCIKALELGAEDYISHPFSNRELALRLR